MTRHTGETTSRTAGGLLPACPHLCVMKAISLLQPWASLVVMGLKTIETRSWATQHRGLILIHASKGKAGSIFTSHPAFKKHIPDFMALRFGFIIGSVVLTDVVRVDETELPDRVLAQLTMEEKAFGDYTGGRFAWLLADPVMFANPVPARGMLNVWDYKGALPEISNESF